jgi:hypothetical protein
LCADLHPRGSRHSCHIPTRYAVLPLATRGNMIRWALRRAIDKVERNLKTDARGGMPVLFDHGLVPTPPDARARTA